jgi:hypothetical protein
MKEGSMVEQWLKDEEGAPSGQKVFGVKKEVYNFADLARVVPPPKKSGPEGSGKRKRKAHDIEEVVRSPKKRVVDTGVEKGKGKEKRKEKEMKRRPRNIDTD